MTDVESMYYQVIVPDNQQIFLKFLWWNDRNLLEEPQDFVCIWWDSSAIVRTTILENLLQTIIQHLERLLQKQSKRILCR